MSRNTLSRVNRLNFFAGNIYATACIALFLFTGIGHAQWTINKERGKRLVVDTYQPINIVTGDLRDGGMFVVWMDKKENPDATILVQQIDVNGGIKFVADGRRLTDLDGKKESPVLKVNGKSDAYILWKDFSYNTIGDLYLQKIAGTGNFEWGDIGRVAGLCKYPAMSYNLSVDAEGNAYIAYIEKADSDNVDYTVKIQRISGTGDTVFPLAGEQVTMSRNIKSNVQVCPDTADGAYIFWVESRIGKNILMMQHIDKSGNKIYTKKPEEISGMSSSIVSYSLVQSAAGEVFVTWLSGTKVKDAYYQLIEANGKKMLSEPKLIASGVKATKSNLTAISSADSTFVVGWIAEKANDKRDFSAQKISRHGAIIWGDAGKSFSSKLSQKFSGSISTDKYSNIYASWIERKTQLSNEFVYGQKLNAVGVPQWDSTGVPVLLSKNTEKSYLTSFADKRQGMVVVFREGIHNDLSKTSRIDYGIYGQRLYAEINAVSVIADLNATVEGDNIMVAFKTSNESKTNAYRIEKFLLKSIKDTAWTNVTVIDSKPFPGSNEYRYSFMPDSDGIYYIRVVQLAGNSPIAASEIQKVSYIREYGEKIVVLQNIPNPVSDSTVVNYYLPRGMPVRIEFYNSRIEKINEVNLSDTRQGRNFYVFKPGRLPDGIYFFRFSAGDVLTVKKFVIAR